MHSNIFIKKLGTNHQQLLIEGHLRVTFCYGLPAAIEIQPSNSNLQFTFRRDQLSPTEVRLLNKLNIPKTPCLSQQELNKKILETLQ